MPSKRSLRGVAATVAAKAGSGDGVGCDSDSNSEDNNHFQLEVRPSTIEGAGQGLFLKSGRIAEGAIVLREIGFAIKRKDSKKIHAIPEWTNSHPVIQGNKDNFLDIRTTLLYKMNHADHGTSACNVMVRQTGAATLTVTALRDLYEGEELMWEYSKNWLAANFG